MKRGLDVEKIRSQFPILASEMRGHRLTYLDSAASAQKPLAVIDAMSDFYKAHYANIHRGVYQLSADATIRYEEVRKRVARFIGAKDSREVIFVRNATEAINLVVVKEGNFFKVSVALSSNKVGNSRVNRSSRSGVDASCLCINHRGCVNNFINKRRSSFCVPTKGRLST